jgi:UDP-N-acetylglucosamine 2-epimerase (non-hydrolysing)
MAPVVGQLLRRPKEFETRIVVTAQHRGLLDQVLEAFSIKTDYDLNVMQPGQSLFDSTARIIAELEPVFEAERPDCVLVQGDTTTTLCGALAGFYRHLPVGHIEAGLRTYDRTQPFPEEMNRVLASRLATLHFAATERAAENLRREGIEATRILITGQTGVDAVMQMRDALVAGQVKSEGLPALDARKKLVLVTAHRRESFGEGFERICRALHRLAGRDDIELVYPVHPNPNVRAVVNRHLDGAANVRLIEPLGYVPFVDLMRRAHLLLTDSGGIQEEAPSLGKPVLVMREKTERPEAVEAGTARLVGTDEDRIVSETALLVEDDAEYGRRSRVHNPYGDGQASVRIMDALRSYFRKAESSAG